MTLKPSYGSLKVMGTDTYRSATYDFLLTFHSNHGPVSYRFRDKLRFQSKIAKFSHPRVILHPIWKGSLGIGSQRSGSQNYMYRMMWLPAEKEIWRHLQPSGYNAPTWQTDGQTDGHRASAKTALIRISSRGKNCSLLSLQLTEKRIRQICRLRWIVCPKAFKKSASGTSPCRHPDQGLCPRPSVILVMTFWLLL